MPDQPRPASRRRWLRTSVRSLIVLVLLFGCWLGWTVRRARIQREAGETRQQTGSDVVYDWERSHDSYFDRDLKATSPAPRWMVDRLGVDYFGYVIQITFSGGDGDFASIRSLEGLESVYIENTKSTLT